MTATDVQQANLAVAAEIARTYRESRVAGLLERFDELFTPDLEWRSAIVGGVEGAVWHGRDGFAAYERELFESFEDVQLDELAHEPVGAEAVVSLGHVRTIGRDSRVDLSGEFAFVWRLRDGRAYAGRSYLSHDEAREEARRAA